MREIVDEAAEASLSAGQLDDAPPRMGESPREWAGKVLLRQESTLLGVVLLIGIVMSFVNPVFVSEGNLVQILRDTVIFFIMACGGAVIIIGGGFDFSVGSVFTMGAMSSTFLMTHSVPWQLAIVGGLVIGAFAGLLNALIIERLGVPPIITTLGTYYILYGLVVVISGGNSILGLPKGFLQFGQGQVAGMPLTVVYAVVVGVAFWCLLEKTPFGINNRAIGGNRDASVSNGLPVRRVERWLYALGGLTAAFAGVLFSARTGVGDVSSGGANITLTVVSSVLIGGISLFGGMGTITGVALGAVLLALIDNAIALTTVPAQFQNVIVGVILILAVAADYFRRKGAQRVGRKAKTPARLGKAPA